MMTTSDFEAKQLTDQESYYDWCEKHGFPPKSWINLKICDAIRRNSRKIHNDVRSRSSRQLIDLPF